MSWSPSGMRSPQFTTQKPKRNCVQKVAKFKDKSLRTAAEKGTKNSGAQWNLATNVAVAVAATGISGVKAASIS